MIVFLKFIVILLVFNSTTWKQVVKAAAADACSEWSVSVQQQVCGKEVLVVWLSSALKVPAV